MGSRDIQMRNTMALKDFCTGVQHIGIPTNDIERTIEFYERLGFSMALRTSNGDEQVAFLQLGNLVIETYQNHAATMQTGAIDHIALNVTHIDELFAWAKELGLELLDEQVNSLPFWEHGVRFFTFLGPNREKIEFCERL